MPPLIPPMGTSPNENAIKVYPNPFNNFFYVEGLDSSPASFLLINSLGQKAMQSGINTVEPIDASQLSPGVYIIQINKGQVAVRQKVVKR